MTSSSPGRSPGGGPGLSLGGVRARDRLQAVELDEDDALAGAAPRPVVARRRRWPWVAAAAVLVAGLAGGQHVLDARHAAHLARFEHVPGVVPTLTGDLRRLWTVPKDSTGEVQAGGHLVTTAVHDGVGLVTGRDVRTGDPAWQAAITPPPSPEDDPELELECSAQAAGGDPARRVVCTMTAGVRGLEGEPGPPAHVEVLDARTGAVVGQWQTRVWMWAVAGDLVVTASPTDHGATRTWALTASRSDGTTAWTHTVEWSSPTRPEGGFASSLVQGDADHVLLSAEGHAELLDARGRVTRRMDADVLTGWSLGRAGVLIKHVVVDAGGGVYTTRSTIDAPGVPHLDQLELSVDDGSAPGVVYFSTDAGGFAAYDVARGRQLWELDLTSLPTILLDGRLYTNDENAIVAIDVRTGRTVWSQPVDVFDGVSATDGHVLYVFGQDGKARSYAIDDGTPGPVFSTSALRLPTEGGGGSDVFAWHGVLVRWTDSGRTDVVG